MEEVPVGSDSESGLERPDSLKGQVLRVRKSSGQQQVEGAHDRSGATPGRVPCGSWEKPNPSHDEILSSIHMVKRIREKPTKKAKVEDLQVCSSETTTVTFAVCASKMS